MDHLFVRKKESKLGFLGKENVIIVISKIYSLCYTFGALLLYYVALNEEMFYIGVAFCIFFTLLSILYYIGLKKRSVCLLVPLIVGEITTNTIFTLLSGVIFMVYIVNIMGLLESVDILQNYIIHISIGIFIILIKDILVFSLIKGYFLIKKKNQHIIILQNEKEYVKLSFTSRPTAI